MVRRWNDATQRALEAGRERAKERRDEGGSTVRVYATAREMYRNKGCEPDNFDIWLISVQERVAQAREDGLRLIYPDRYEDIPF